MATKIELMNKLIEDCEKIIESCGYQLPQIKYSLNPKNIRCIGRCKSITNRMTGAKSDVRIEFTESYFLAYTRLKQYDKIRNTILHEMCHALPKAINHGSQWQQYAYVVGKKSGQNISRLAETDDVLINMRESRVKYIIECQECGKEYTYLKKPKVANRLSECKCSVCKSANLILKTK